MKKMLLFSRFLEFKQGLKSKNTMSSDTKKPSRKRKNEDEISDNPKKPNASKKDQELMQPINKRLNKMGLNFPAEVPNNTNQYKYFLCEPDPFCPESENKELDYHGGIIPSKHYRRWWPDQVLLRRIFEFFLGHLFL